MAASKRAGGSPIRRALASTSSLQTLICEGLAAVKKKDRSCLAVEVRSAVADSLDIDAAFEENHPQENRWDYLLGHLPSGQVVGLEPHSAKQDEISTVIRKKRAALQQLAEHLKPGRRVSKWFWVASGKVHFARTEKVQRSLDEHGIQFVSHHVLARHLT